MSRYPEVESFDHAAVEEAVLERWQREKTFEQSLEIRRDAPHFVFYEGPPTANGKPGIHHVMSRTIKDLFCRYKTMKGFRVDRKAGWDTHGLPVEIEVEKELGLEGRHQVEEYGVAKYNAKCRESVLRYKDLWDELTVRMGYWVDLSDPYVTFENSYIESVWNLLQRIYEKGYLYKGHKILWYSPANGTVLSSHEVALGYKEVQDVSIVTRAKLVGEENTYLLVWTTTPWTIPANAAMAVGEKIEYVKVRQTKEDGADEFLILAAARVDATLKGEFEIVERMTGVDLVGRRYEPMWPLDLAIHATAFADLQGDSDTSLTVEMFIGLSDADHGAQKLLEWSDAKGKTAAEIDHLVKELRAYRIVQTDYVTTEDGTGIVHTAPAFGADDYSTGQREALPTINPINPDGTFSKDCGEIGGLWFKDADRPIIRDLAERGLLYREDSFIHNYPHDWRKGTPLMQYPVESWFIRTTAIKDRLVELNQTINWQPEGIGTGRFGQWLEGNVDWALSRMRFWGTPLPIWVSDTDPDHAEVIGSIDELREKCSGSFPDEAINPDTGEVDLHRPYVDAITWPGPNGGTMRRVPDLIDVWFDSGAMPFAQWHYPFENEEVFQANFPADFIAEGVDQTRGWFYTMHAIAALVEDSVAFKNVVVNGLVLDADGAKMSKTVGNTVDPFETIDKHGADPVRWTMMASCPPWESLRYTDSAIVETRRKVFGTLVNTYKFFATYANLDEFVYDNASRIEIMDRSELDRWVLSRLNTTIAATDEAYAAYHPTRAARAVETFVDDLSNWYLRRSRRRFWKSEDDGDKRAAYQTLFECLRTTAQLMAPIAPFFAEWLYGCLTEGGGRQTAEEEGVRSAVSGQRSVHLTDFPRVTESEVNQKLEHRMALARQVASNVLSLRNEASINVRQPLAKVLVVTGAGGVDADELRSVESIVLDEVNVKALEAIEASSGVIHKSAKPNFKALGKKLGPLMKAANAVIRDLDLEAIATYEQEESLTLELDGQSVTLESGDLEIVSEGIEGQLVRQEGGVTVALDTTITDELRAEGLAREFINRVQNLRKSADFDVSDRIVITFDAPDGEAEAVIAHAETIRTETLATALNRAEPEGDTVQTVDLAGAPITIGVRRINGTPAP
ncbi:MAG: isoleucine--tRNA ligase [Bacteroidetes bacterium]|nr:isoleucine--tRNA ligase [Bacteroidota bacterium]